MLPCAHLYMSLSPLQLKCIFTCLSPTLNSELLKGTICLIVLCPVPGKESDMSMCSIVVDWKSTQMFTFTSNKTITVNVTWNYQRRKLKEIVPFSSGSCMNEHECGMHVWTTDFNSVRKKPVSRIWGFILTPSRAAGKVNAKGDRSHLHFWALCFSRLLEDCANPS